MSRTYTEPEIEYTLEMTIDGEEVATIQSYSLEGLEEDFRKLEHAKEDWLERQEGLAELEQE